MATAEHTQATEPATADGWTAEIELRRYTRSKYPESNKDDYPYLGAPDLTRAEHFDPDGENAACCYNDNLRAIEGVNVYDDRIVVPRETVAKATDADPERDEYDDYPDQFAALLDRITRNMRINEFYGGDRGTAWAIYGSKLPELQDNYPFTGRDYSDTADPDKTDPRPIYLRLPRDHRYNKLQQLYEERKKDGRTLLAVIVARDAATGTGKTTLACQLAKAWDTNGWTAERATLDPSTYADKYTDEDTPSKSVLLLDEAEQAADNRRSMSNQNVKLSHLWATMRFREIYSIITLPSASMLDKRLKELADLKIVVHNRGTAVAYKTKIDDHTGEYRAKRLCRLRWDDLDGDPEYETLTDKKAERMRNYAETFSYNDNGDDTTDPREIERDYRLKVIEQMSAAGYTQAEIADALPDISDRSTVSKLLNQ